MTDYTTLIAARTTTGSIAYMINFDRIDSAGIVNKAEKFIFRKIRVREMLVVGASITIELDANTATLPTGFLDPIHFGIPGYCHSLAYLDTERFRAELAFDQDGALPTAMPTRFTVDGTLMHFDVNAEQEYTGRLTYFGRPDPLSTSNANWLTDRYPDLLERTCLMYALEERKEWNERNTVMGLIEKDLDEIKRENDLAMRSMSLDFNWRANS
jgi:hypothetical protein